MKESDARKMQCPHRSVGVGIVAALLTHGKELDELFRNAVIEDIKNSGLCCTVECPMWEVQLVNEDVTAEEKPDGEGWYQIVGAHAKSWRRYVPTENGECGIKPVCNGCSYPG